VHSQNWRHQVNWRAWSQNQYVWYDLLHPIRDSHYADPSPDEKQVQNKPLNRACAVEVASLCQTNYIFNQYTFQSVYGYTSVCPFLIQRIKGYVTSWLPESSAAYVKAMYCYRCWCWLSRCRLLLTRDEFFNLPLVIH
jgi:hypothetical protein